MRIFQIYKPEAHVRNLGIGLGLALGLAACAKPEFTEEQVKSKLLTLHMQVQAKSYGEALKLLTKEERKAISNPQGQMLDEYKVAFRNLNTATLSTAKLNLDKYGNLVGVKELLDQNRGMDLDLDMGESPVVPDSPDESAKTEFETAPTEPATDTAASAEEPAR